MTRRTAKRPGARSNAASHRRVLSFPRVKGKIVDRVEINLSAEDCSIEIRFDDKTALNIEMEPEHGIKVTPDFADWRTGNWKSIQRWKPVRVRSARA